MPALARLVDWHAQLAQALDHLRSLLLLATRLWVSWQFLKSGWLKLSHWDVTQELFRSEYQVKLEYVIVEYKDKQYRCVTGLTVSKA